MVTQVMAGNAAMAATPPGQTLANANACMGCHAVNRKLVGPSFQQIASKYKDDPQATAKLSQKIKRGGAGVWGSIPMPAHPSMSDANIRVLVDWVMAGSPAK
ncbi:c-type cytochrome [Paraburkholderia bonniea]|nr:c-type cytochrome [Paraburkholderia bonniea]WJF91472.1 c-type cytochrome [Paraburkholderia bonniea]WJF94791.1 c-type cytochrome [Paraburkholderia bonniea]